MNSPITLISDPAVLKIPIIENGEEMVDLEKTDILLDYRKKVSKNYYFARKAIVDKLRQAKYSLPINVQFLIIETFRPLKIQKKYFKEYSQELRDAHPDWNEDRIYTEASKYVAPPEITPPHSTGGAIDLTLCDDFGDELDMGTRVNADPEESNNACFTVAENISDIAKQNRQILTKALSSVGFVNYPTEWWHWSYGDRYWAHQTNEKHAIYGAIEI